MDAAAHQSRADYCRANSQRLRAAGGALLVVEREDPVPVPIHHLLYDGSFAVAVPVDRGEVSGSQALLELTDYAPLPVREPVRSLVWIRGCLHQIPPAELVETLDLIATDNPNPALLQVETRGPGRPMRRRPGIPCSGWRSNP